MAMLTLLLLLSGLILAASLDDGDPECELTTGRALTVIKSAGFPGRYSSNVDCRYTVRRRSRSVCSVTFLFNVMDLEQSPNCTKDYLMLSGEKLCGSKPIGFSRTVPYREGEEVTLTFHSDNDTRGLGYMVTVVQQDCPPPSCDAIFKQESFLVHSPNFPLPYSNGLACRYTIEKWHPGTCRLQLQVDGFDLEEDEDCASDFLAVDGQKFCGTMPKGRILEIPFSNETLVMEFQSDHVTTRDGFQFEAHQVICDQTSDASIFTSEVALSVVETTPDVNISTSTPVNE